MKCRDNKEPNDEGLEPGSSTDSSDILEDLLQVGSWMNGPGHPTEELDIPEADGK